MDCKLQNGDHGTDGRGLPLTIVGREEICQRAAIRLTVRRGSLPELPNLGSRLYQLRRAGNAALTEEAVAAVREALLPMEGVWAEGITVGYDGVADRVTVDLTLRLGEEALPLTVEI